MAETRPLVYDAMNHSPKGSRMFFVGDSLEHASRVGSTIHQYFAMAGELADLDVPEDNIFAHRRFVLEDANRNRTDTVVGGAFITLLKVGSKAIEAHLTSAFVREEYRAQGLANFVIGRLLADIQFALPLNKFVIHETDKLHPGLAISLGEKVFSSSDDGSLYISMPGRYISRFSLEELAAAGDVRGVHNRTLFQDGQVMGSYKFKTPKHDLLGDKSVLMYDADGNEIARWNDIYTTFEEDDPRNNYDVDWGLSAAIRILNPPVQ